jgi:hypothetical protein
MRKIIEVADGDFAGTIQWELSEGVTNALAKLTPEAERVTATALSELMSIFAGNLSLCLIQENPEISISLLKAAADGVQNTFRVIRAKLSS